MSSCELKTSLSASSATGCASTPPFDYYAVLGIQRNATKTDIKQAYGQLAWTWHPLKNLAYRLEANDMFKKIAEAYEILSDGETRRQYDADLTNGMPFTVRDFAFADPYDIFDDFQSFKGLKLGDDDDIYISSASEDEDEEDAMSIGSGTDYSRADEKNWQIETIEYSVTRHVVGDAVQVKADSTSTAGDGSDQASGVSQLSATSDDGARVEDGSKDGDEMKMVHLLAETRPDGRQYMTIKMSENGVETMNVVREGGITDTDIAEVERLVDW